MKNAINVIKPYLWNGMWVFDDDRVGLSKEPFVAGISQMIWAILEKNQIKNGEQGWLCLFSENPFPGAEVLEWVRYEGSGDVYSWNGMEGWLCPALRLYFPQAPAKLYVQAQESKIGQKRDMEMENECLEAFRRGESKPLSNVIQELKDKSDG